MSITHNYHGPENAEHELRKAYNTVIETGVTHFWDRAAVQGVHPDEAFSMYKRAYQAYRDGNRLASERWARTSKHLSRAFWHEAKIAYLEPRSSELPFLEGATAEEYSLHEKSDTTVDLLDSLESHIPDGKDSVIDEMRRYLSRARRHLQSITSSEDPASKHELLRAEHIKAAHEYGRVVECMTLAHEAESRGKAA